MIETKKKPLSDLSSCIYGDLIPCRYQQPFKRGKNKSLFEYFLFISVPKYKYHSSLYINDRHICNLLVNLLKIFTLQFISPYWSQSYMNIIEKQQSKWHGEKIMVVELRSIWFKDHIKFNTCLPLQHLHSDMLLHNKIIFHRISASFSWSPHHTELTWGKKLLWRIPF